MKSKFSAKSYLGFTILILFCLHTSARAQQDIVINSPNKQLKMTIYSSPFSYDVSLNNQPILQKSLFKLASNSESLTNRVSITIQNSYQHHHSYPKLGGHSIADDYCNGITLTIKTAKGLIYQLECRVFNDAASYRFLIPKNPRGQTIQENSTFTLPNHAIIWHHDMRMHYEGVYQKSNIDTLKSGVWVAPPATFETTSGNYGSITEADLKNYSGMTLKYNGQKGLDLTLSTEAPVSYPYELRYTKADIDHLAKAPKFYHQVITPWRVILAGKNLNVLVNSDAISSLNPAPDPKLFPQGPLSDWIKTGPAVWKYLDGGGDGTLENMERFSDDAAKLGFKFNILEGFWSKWSDQDIKTLVSHSKQEGVGIFVWIHSKNIRDDQVRHALFQRCHDLGISGLKIDFFDSEAKEVVDLYQNILKETAALHLFVDFHGSNKPTGENRTWPNELTREAVKGMEASKLEDRATHQTTLPFTRWLAGPAEYTPVHFGDRRKNTTWVNQIASAAILSAPMLTYAASPEHLLENPGVEMIKSIPSTWDETQVLSPSQIGDLAIFARRKGNVWFLAIMNGTQPKEINIPLNFLGKNNYQALIYKDAKDKGDAIVQDYQILNQSDSLKVNLKSGGGFIAKFELH